MADVLNTLKANILSDLRTSSAAGDLKDGNIPVKNIWDTLEWANPMPSQLPLIQFDIITASASSYLGDGMENIPFTVQFICWVSSKNDKSKAATRARNLRETLVASLHTNKPFSDTTAARQALRIMRESDPFLMKRFAVGMGLTVSGDILQQAGVA